MDLTRLGTRQTAADCAAYSALPRAFVDGTCRLPSRSYYSDPPVKAALLAAHHRKCCYCEAKYRVDAYLHVEHYRPKRGVRQSRAETRDELPGYYWLAYAWPNLLLSCHDCNSRCKGTLFPLANPTRRARSHTDNLARERPLLIDPAAEDPSDHLQFSGVQVVPRTRRGKSTVEVVGLDRAALREHRNKVLANFRAGRNIHRLARNSPNGDEMRRIALELMQTDGSTIAPDVEFSAMLAAELAADPLEAPPPAAPTQAAARRARPRRS